MLDCLYITADKSANYNITVLKYLVLDPGYFLRLVIFVGAKNSGMA